MIFLLLLVKQRMKKTTANKKTGDLPESADDKKHLQPETATLDLPEVKDIPGQEKIVPFPTSEGENLTVASADEEAEELLDDDELTGNSDTNVSREEKDLLQRSSESMAGSDDENARRAVLDNTDEDGTPLNEAADLSGSDLDVPGSEEDDANEEIGEEDEENNSFSLPDQ
jgi:hypothetical protein